MYRLLLEVDDSAPYVKDQLFERPRSSQVQSTDDDGQSAARVKTTGQREFRSFDILQYDMSSATGNQCVPFFSGNPVVETASGILHLYICAADRQSTENVSTDSSTRKGEGSYRENELPPNRSVTLCVMAVPNAFSVTDLLTFLAPVEKGLVHLRIISDTAKCEIHYMVLLQFMDQELADEFYTVYNNTRFSFLEEAVCHVVYVQKITNAKSSEMDLKLRFGITELPSCAVCLERIDEGVSGILTTLCNHTFHCECMKSWRDHSCPVCRHTQQPDSKNVCEVCSATEGLWICLICGHVGCGRYLDKHSYLHFSETQHTYAMELETRRVWDYVADNYVHRLIQSTSDGKPVEVGSTSANENEKVDSLTLEYTYLLTSQLESQRRYYTEQLAEQTHLAECKIRSLEAKLRQMKVDDQERVSRLANQMTDLEDKYDEEMEVGRSMVSAQIEWQKRVMELEKAREEDSRKKDAIIQDLQEQLHDLMLYLDTKEKLDKQLGADAADGCAEIVAISGMSTDSSVVRDTNTTMGRKKTNSKKKGKKK